MSRLSVIENSKRVSSSNRLTEDDHDRTILLNSTTAFVTTLPPLRDGLKMRFIVRTAPSSGSHTVVTHNSANVIIGTASGPDYNSATDADFETVGCDTISFVSTRTVRGDRVEMYCDGVNWYAWANASVFDAITFTTAS